MGSSATIPMIAPDGTSADVPISQQQVALKAGAKPAYSMLAPDGSHAYVPPESVSAAQKAGARFANYSQNPKLEGTYPMWDTAGHRIGVPYSLVNSAHGEGYQFDTNANSSGLTPAQQFTKDEAADPNRTGGTSMTMAPAGARWSAPPEPTSRQESLQRLGQAETDAPLPVRMITGSMKGAATMARPAIDVMNRSMDDGNTPQEQSYMMEGRTPAETAAKVGTIGALMAPAAIEAPVATALGLAGGAAGSYAGGKVATAMGADPKTSAVVGDIAGLAGGVGAVGMRPTASLGAAGEAPATGAEGPVNAMSLPNRLVGGIGQFMPEAVRNGTIASGWDWAANKAKGAIAGDVNAPIAGNEADLTPAQRYVSMKAMGMKPNAAEATNSAPLKGAQWLNEDSLFAAPTYTKARAENLAALNRFTNEKLVAASPQPTDAGLATVQNSLLRMQDANQAEHVAQVSRILDHASPLGPEEGGAAIQQGLRNAQTGLQNDAANGFSELDKAVGNRKLSGMTIQQTAKNIYDANADYFAKHPSLVPTQAWKLVKDLAGADTEFQSRPMSFGEVHQLRSDLLELVRTNPDIVKNQAGGWLQQLADAADQTMTRSAGGLNPQGTQIFRDANEAWANMKGTYDNPSHPFYQAVRTPAPSTLVKGIGQTPEMAKTLQSALGPEGIGPIQRGVAEKLLGTAKEGGYDFKNFQANWNKLPQPYREALFTPGQISQFEDLANRTANNPFYDPQNVLYKIANARDPSTVLNLVKTPEAVDALKSVLGPEDMGPIQRGVAENLLRTTKEGGYNFKTFQGQWNKLSDAYKNKLFTPEQIKEFDDIGNAGTVMHEDVNPSGSAHMGQKMFEMGEAGGTLIPAVTGHPLPLAATIAYHAAQYALGKRMNAPTFVDWLMRDQEAAPAAAASTASRMIPAAVMGGTTGPLEQPNYYSDDYLRSKAAFDAARGGSSSQ